MTTATSNRSASMPAWADAETLAAVRPEVRSILEASRGFQALEPEEKRALAANMVKIAAYMSNPDGLAKQEAGQELGPDGDLARQLAEKKEDPVEATKRRLSEKQGFAGKDFEAGALRQG